MHGQGTDQMVLTRGRKAANEVASTVLACIAEGDRDAGAQAPQLLHLLPVLGHLEACRQPRLLCLLGEGLHMQPAQVRSHIQAALNPQP